MNDLSETAAPFVEGPGERSWARFAEGTVLLAGEGEGLTWSRSRAGM